MEYASSNIQTRKKVNFNDNCIYLKLKCKLCSEQVEYQNYSQLRYHVERHEDSLKRDIYLELLK